MLYVMNVLAATILNVMSVGAYPPSAKVNILCYAKERAMRKDVYTIDMKLPSLNEYINLCRTNKYKAAKFKENIEADIALFLMRMPKYTTPVKIHFHWIEGNKRRDLDNICFAKKFILDAMVKAGKLKDDNRKCVTAFTDNFYYGYETKVILEIEEVKQ